MAGFNVQTYMQVFTGLNATIAGLAFAAIVFLLRGSPSGDQLQDSDRQERDQALAVLVVCIIAHLLTAALAAAAAGSPGATAPWIIAALIVPIFIIGAANLIMTIYLLLRANAATMPARLAGSAFDLVLLVLIIDAFGFALSATAIIGEWFVRPIDMPLWVIGLYGIAAAAPVAIASYFSTRPRALSFASNSATFETLLSSEVFFIMTLATVAAAMTIIQPISVSRDLWLVISLAALAMTATLLSVARLWLHGTKRRIAAAG